MKYIEVAIRNAEGKITCYMMIRLIEKIQSFPLTVDVFY